jgi:predicted transcriptional regulator
VNETVTITARIPAKNKERLEVLAQATGRKKGFLVAQALEEYPETQAWRIEETLKAIHEADAGNFPADDEELRAFHAKWV